MTDDWPPKPPWPTGTRARIKDASHIDTMVLIPIRTGDRVVTVIRAHPILPQMVEVEGGDGYRNWLGWDELYPLRPAQ